MANPFDQSLTLLSLTDGLRTAYHPKVAEPTKRMGSVVNRMLPVKDRSMHGPTLEIQVLAKLSFSARHSKGINSPFGRPALIGAEKYTVTLSETDDNNDLRRLHNSVSVTELDRKRGDSGDKAFLTNMVEKIMRIAMGDVNELQAVSQFMDTDGKLANVNGTPKKNDRELMFECASVAATGGARVKVDDGNVAYFPRGRQVAIYSSADVFRMNAEVTDRAARDSSIGLYGYDANHVPSSAVDISTIADNDKIYIEDGKNQAPKTINSWMTRPSATGESFFGRDRTSPSYRFMQPNSSGPSTLTPYSPSVLDAAAAEMSFITPEEREKDMMFFAEPWLIESHKRSVGNDSVLQYPTGDDAKSLQAKWGFVGAVHRHERLGRLVLTPEPLMKPSKIWLLREGSWEEVHAQGVPNFYWTQGMQGIWYRCNSPANDGSLTLVWRADGYQLSTVLCLDPPGNMVIENVERTVGPSIAA